MSLKMSQLKCVTTTDFSYYIKQICFNLYILHQFNYIPSMEKMDKIGAQRVFTFLNQLYGMIQLAKTNDKTKFVVIKLFQNSRLIIRMIKTSRKTSLVNT